MMEIAKNSLAVNLPDGSALIYQALHLAKVSAVYGQIVKNGGFVRKWLARKKAITDKMGKNSRLSVKIQTFRTRFYGQMLQKAACVRKSSS